jgi:cell volume regulation protein A
MSGDHVILVAGVLLAAAVAASMAAARLGIPSLLLFLAVGMAAGADGAGWVSLGDYGLARDVSMAALALILFDGGLRSGLSELRGVLRPSLLLALPGTALVAVLTSVAAALLFSLSALDSLLLGSIVASTDSAAVFGLLRGSALSRRLVRTIEGESGFNDPVALILVAGFVDWIDHPGYGLVDMATLALRSLLLGGLCGYLVGRLAGDVLARLRLPFPGLYPAASLAVAAVAYGTATATQGSGFLAVYVAALVLAEARIPGRQTIGIFHDGVAWIAQAVLFLVLGLLVRPSELEAVAAEGTALALVVVLLARPLATLAATIGEGFTLPERAVLSWAGLRGAVPIVFATIPVAAGVPGSREFLNVVFFAVIVSTLLQGLTFLPFARALGLTAVAAPLPRPLAEFGGVRRLGAEFVEYPVTVSDGVVGRRVRDLEFPLGMSLAVIVRGDEAFPPAASSRLKAGDALHFLVREEVSWRVPELLQRLSDGAREPTVADRYTVEPGGLVAEPWTPAHGDATDPVILLGTVVVENIRRRTDGRGALVQLEDGRYGVTGATLAVGPAEALRRYAGRHAATAFDEGDARWWREVADALRR